MIGPSLARPGWEVVVCCGGGPSFTAEQAATIMAAQAAGRCRVIVTNNGWQRVPTADALYAHDTNWWKRYAAEVRAAGFAGELLTQQRIVAKVFKLRHLPSKTKEGLGRQSHTIHACGTSGHGAIDIARAFGARRILLVGYDMQRTGGMSHWHGDHVDGLSKGQHFAAWLKLFPMMERDARALGIEIINCTTETAITCFARERLEDALARPLNVPAPPAPMTEQRPLTSIIIPTYQHADCIHVAVGAALLQRDARVEVVVVDDGSTDGTVERLAALFPDDSSLRVLTVPHGGPARARNAGIDAASGDFLMFLDADDTIEPTKVAESLAAFTDETGFVICDTRIVEPDGRVELASKRYDYRGKDVGGWIAPLLAVANFIPIHAGLIRRDALGELRFEDRELEDWHFWYALSTRARCRFLPRALATYRKRRGSRNSAARATPATKPGVEPPLRLNLACGTPGALSWHPMPGLVNLDKSMGWRFEDGLADFADGSVAGITISHALMYVRDADMSGVIAEFARVLEPGGVLRITEDDTAHTTDPRRRGGWKGSEPAVTLTSPAMMRRHLEAAGFTVHDVDAETTLYRDHSLMQAQHGRPPDVFFMEGVRERAVLFAPHADDEALFAAYTVIRHRPDVVICCPSSRDYGETETRLKESEAAVRILGGGCVTQWSGLDLVEQMTELDRRLRPTIVFAPSPETSHPEHQAVAVAAEIVFHGRLRKYHTYDAAGKVRRGLPVPHEPGWAERKREALACYRTQIEHPRAQAWFDLDLAEYAP